MAGKSNRQPKSSFKHGNDINELTEQKPEPLDQPASSALFPRNAPSPEMDDGNEQNNRFVQIKVSSDTDDGTEPQVQAEDTGSTTLDNIDALNINDSDASTTTTTSTPAPPRIHSQSPSITSQSSISSSITDTLRLPGMSGAPVTSRCDRGHSPQTSLNSVQLSNQASLSPSRTQPFEPVNTGIHSMITGPKALDTNNPPELISWGKLRKISNQLYSSSNFSKYGKPQCIYAGNSIAVGTFHGYVLIFDYNQDLKVALRGHKSQLFGEVTCLTLSADQTAVAAGHSCGDIVVWDLTKKSVLVHVRPIKDSSSTKEEQDPSKHIWGTPITHVGFVDKRHSAVVSCDTLGYVFYHESIRSFDGKSVVSRRILGKRRSEQDASKAIVLSMAYRTLGPIPQPMDSLGLVALITPYMIVVVSIFPQIRTQWRAARPKYMDLSMGLSACLAWYPNNQAKLGSKLAYCWSNVINVVEVSQSRTHGIGEDHIELKFRANKRYICDESVVALQWLNSELLALVTITQRLIILNAEAMATCTSIDILNRHLMHYDIFSAQVSIENKPIPVADAYFNSVKSFKGRLFLLGKYELVLGTLTNWADRLLDIMNRSDYVNAIHQMTAFFDGTGDMALSGLPSNDDERHAIVIRSLPDMLMGCLNYTIHSGQPLEDQNSDAQTDIGTVENVIHGCFSALVAVYETQQYQSTALDLLAQAWDTVEGSAYESQFLQQLIPLINGGYFRVLPPALYRSLIQYSDRTQPECIEGIVCRIDTSTLDLDLVFNVCERHHLRDTKYFIYTQMLGDYEFPLKDLMDPMSVTEVVLGGDEGPESRDIYKYLDDILDGRTYPLGQAASAEKAIKGKETTYAYILEEGVLQRLVEGDPEKFFTVLNRAFEDLFLNEHPKFNRQTIVNHLLETRANVQPESTSAHCLDRFLANNYSKYPQFIILTGKVLHELLSNIIYEGEGDRQEDSSSLLKSREVEQELALCSILSRYKPTDLDEVVAMLYSQKHYGVLQYVFRSEQRYDRVLSVVIKQRLEQSLPSVAETFDIIDSCFRLTSTKKTQQRFAIQSQVTEHIEMLAELSCERLVDVLSRYDPSSHELALKFPSNLQFQYLHALFTRSVQGTRSVRAANVSYSMDLRHAYVHGLCRRGLVTSLYTTLKNTFVNKDDIELPRVVDDLIEVGAVDSLVLLLLRHERIGEAMIYLCDKLLDQGSIATAWSEKTMSDVDGRQSEQSSFTEESIKELQRYIEIGTEVCRAESNPQKSEGLWIRLIGTVMDVSESVSSSLRHSLLQGVVSSLLNTKTFFGQTSLQHDQSVIKILRAILLPSSPTSTTTASSSDSTVAEGKRTIGVTRPFIEDLFAAYRYQYSMLSIFQRIMNADTYHNFIQLVIERDSGWRVTKSGECEGCGEKVVGVGIDADKLYAQWQTRSLVKKGKHGQLQPHIHKISHSEARAQVEQAKKDDTMLAVFKCGHTYHVGCLRRLGSVDVQCIVCD